MLSFKYMTIILLLVDISWPPTSSLPQGAPDKICYTMLPFHGGGILPSKTVPPFGIETSSSILGQGQTIRVDIAGIPQGLSFAGFMIQARNQNPPYKIIGQFKTLDETAQLMNCENSVNNSVTHTHSKPKTGLSLEWQAPVDFVGQVLFNLTVAKSYDTFWVGIQSNTVEIVKGDLVQPAIRISTTRTPSTTAKQSYIPSIEAYTPVLREADPFYTDCGQSKTCFGFPDGCVKEKSCKIMSAVLVRGDIYEFELKTGNSSPAFVALGLSDDNKMGDDLVIECIPQGGKVMTYLSFTSGPSNYGTTRSGVHQNSVKLVKSSVADGLIYCKVEQQPIAKVQEKVFDLINNKYHLLLASGSSIKENGVGYHNLGRIPSAIPINLAEVQDLLGSSTLLLRLHGAFMVTAWIGTTSLGILLARYFKQTWTRSQKCGNDQWFQWHRIFMVMTFSLTMAAFIIIFVEIGGWSAERNPHAVLGLITTILCFIQPIGALFRPAPNSKNRPLFNWLHWLVGNLAHIFGIIAIFFSVKLEKARLPDWIDWILVSFVVFHVIIHLVYSIAGCSSDREYKQRINSFPMGDISSLRHGMKTEQKVDAPYAGFRKGLLTANILILVLFVAVIITVIVLAPIEESFKNVKSVLSE